VHPSVLLVVGWVRLLCGSGLRSWPSFGRLVLGSTACPSSLRLSRSLVLLWLSMVPSSLPSSAYSVLFAVCSQVRWKAFLVKRVLLVDVVARVWEGVGVGMQVLLVLGMVVL